MANNANVPHEAEDGFDKVNPKKSEGVQGHFIEQNPAPEVAGVRGETAMDVLSVDREARRAKAREIFGTDNPKKIESLLTDVRSTGHRFAGGKGWAGDIFGKSPDGKWEVCLHEVARKSDPKKHGEGGFSSSTRIIVIKSLVNPETKEKF